MGFAFASVRGRRSWDLITSQIVLGEDENAPLQFQQSMEMAGQLPLSCSPSERDCHLSQGREYLERAELQMTSLRSQIISHFPSFRVAATQAITCLNCTCWALVRSTLRKIFCVGGREVNLLLARRALSQSSRIQKRRKSVELGPIQAHPKVMSFRSNVSYRKVVPI